MLTFPDSLSFSPQAILAIRRSTSRSLLDEQIALLHYQEESLTASRAQVPLAAATQTIASSPPPIRLLIAPDWGAALEVPGGMIWLQGFHDKLYIRVLGEVAIDAMQLVYRPADREEPAVLPGRRLRSLDERSSGRQESRRGSAIELSCKRLHNPGEIFALPTLNARTGKAQLWRCRGGSALRILGKQQGTLELVLEQEGEVRSLGRLELSETRNRQRLGGTDPELDARARLDSINDDLLQVIDAYHTVRPGRFREALTDLCSYRGGERTLGRWQNLWLNALAAELIRHDRSLAKKAGCGMLREYGQLLFAIDSSL